MAIRYIAFEKYPTQAVAFRLPGWSGSDQAKSERSEYRSGRANLAPGGASFFIAADAPGTSQRGDDRESAPGLAVVRFTVTGAEPAAPQVGPLAALVDDLDPDEVGLDGQPDGEPPAGQPGVAVDDGIRCQFRAGKHDIGCDGQAINHPPQPPAGSTHLIRPAGKLAAGQEPRLSDGS